MLQQGTIIASGLLTRPSCLPKISLYLPQFFNDSLVQVPDLVLQLLGQQQVGVLLLLELQEEGLARLAGLAVSGHYGGSLEQLRLCHRLRRLLGK